MSSAEKDLFSRKVPSREYAELFGVVVESRKKYGGGVLFDNGLVITVNHIVKSKKDLKVNSLPAKIIYQNLKYDLAVLSAPIKPPCKLKFAEQVKHGQIIGMRVPVRDRVNFGGRIVLAYVRHQVIFADKDMLCAGMLTESGTCGGGMFSVDGLCGIVDSDKSLAYAQSFSIKAIRQVMDEARRVRKQSFKQRRRYTYPRMQEKQARLPFPAHTSYLYQWTT
jgi:hypothetical protein